MLILTAGVALMSAYFFWRFWAAFRGLGRWRLAAVGVLVVLASARYWTAALERAGLHSASEIGRLVLLIWMVLLFWFVCVGILLQTLSLLAWLVTKRWAPAKRLRLSARSQFVIASAAVVLATAWGFVEARNVGVEHVVVEVDNMPPGRDRITIAQISDLHIGNAMSRQRLDAAARHIEQLRPDVIVSTGDLVDGEHHETDHMAEALARLDAPLGKFAVLGNHEFYSGLDSSMSFHQRAGFEVLRQQSARPLDGLRIAGVDDPAARRRGDGRYIDEMPVLAESPRDEVVVLLKHQPVVSPAAEGLFDLQLSGHTHGGQVFPFNFLIRLRFPFGSGRHSLAGGGVLYVSRGTGTWGPPLRLAARPEVTLIELRRRR